VSNARRFHSFGIGIAAAALAIYVIAMLWPYLAATLVRGSTITAWTHLTTAPILGRAPAAFPPTGATVGAATDYLESVRELDRQRRALMKRVTIAIGP
jgi:hypothetical protein